MSASEAWSGYKPQSFVLLELHEGDLVLDVGCGTGTDARAIAGLVPGVSVMGVDASEETIDAARKETLGLPRPVDFRVGDAHALAFDDESFDACRADKVLHHLADPRTALAEMVRVARPEARIVVSDTDYETLVVDGGDHGLARRIVGHHADRLESGRIGRQLVGLLADLGLQDVTIFPYTATVREYDEELLKLRDKAERAEAAGAIAPGDAARWVAALEAADRAGRFFCALTIFTVRGRRP